MAHPLDSAFLRIQRASEHLEDLKVRVAAFLHSQRDRFGIKLHAPDPEDFSKMKIEVPADTDSIVLLDASVRVGEMVYNLRAALDYLVYALAVFDSGKPQTGTQFPIVDTPDDFRGREKTWLKGVNRTHIAQIEQLQPYNGCQWSQRLRDLSNPDKHRHLILVKGATGMQLRITVGDDIDVIGDDAVVSAKGTSGDDVVNVQAHVRVHIGFDDGAPVVETLQTLKLHVAQVLEAFKSEFQ